MKVSLRVLSAVSEKKQPDPADVEALREYLNSDVPPSGIDELACEVIQKALDRRAKVRAAFRGV